MTEDEDEGYDWGKIQAIAIIACIVCAIVFFAILGKNYLDIQPFKKICAENPRLRYEVACGDTNDCINKCAKHQYEVRKT